MCDSFVKSPYISYKPSPATIQLSVLRSSESASWLAKVQATLQFIEGKFWSPDYLGPVRDFRFLCPNNTKFDQANFICANWWDVDCDDKGKAPSPPGQSTPKPGSGNHTAAGSTLGYYGSHTASVPLTMILTPSINGTSPSLASVHRPRKYFLENVEEEYDYYYYEDLPAEKVYDPVSPRPQEEGYSGSPHSHSPSPHPHAPSQRPPPSYEQWVEEEYDYYYYEDLPAEKVYDPVSPRPQEEGYSGSPHPHSPSPHPQAPSQRPPPSYEQWGGSSQRGAADRGVYYASSSTPSSKKTLPVATTPRTTTRTRHRSTTEEPKRPSVSENPHEVRHESFRIAPQQIRHESIKVKTPPSSPARSPQPLSRTRGVSITTSRPLSERQPISSAPWLLPQRHSSYSAPSSTQAPNRQSSRDQFDDLFYDYDYDYPTSYAADTAPPQPTLKSKQEQHRQQPRVPQPVPQPQPTSSYYSSRPTTRFQSRSGGPRNLVFKEPEPSLERRDLSEHSSTKNALYARTPVMSVSSYGEGRGHTKPTTAKGGTLLQPPRSYSYSYGNYDPDSNTFSSRTGVSVSVSHSTGPFPKNGSVHQQPPNKTDAVKPVVSAISSLSSSTSSTSTRKKSTTTSPHPPTAPTSPKIVFAPKGDSGILIKKSEPPPGSNLDAESASTFRVGRSEASDKKAFHPSHYTPADLAYIEKHVFGTKTIVAVRRTQSSTSSVQKLTGKSGSAGSVHQECCISGEHDAPNDVIEEGDGSSLNFKRRTWKQEAVLVKTAQGCVIKIPVPEEGRENGGPIEYSDDFDSCMSSEKPSRKCSLESNYHQETVPGLPPVKESPRSSMFPAIATVSSSTSASSSGTCSSTGSKPQPSPLSLLNQTKMATGSVGNLAELPPSYEEQILKTQRTLKETILNNINKQNPSTRLLTSSSPIRAHASLYPQRQIPWDGPAASRPMVWRNGSMASSRASTPSRRSLSESQKFRKDPVTYERPWRKPRNSSSKENVSKEVEDDDDDVMTDTRVESAPDEAFGPESTTGKRRKKRRSLTRLSAKKRDLETQQREVRSRIESESSSETEAANQKLRNSLPLSNRRILSPIPPRKVESYRVAPDGKIKERFYNVVRVRSDSPAVPEKQRLGLKKSGKSFSSSRPTSNECKRKLSQSIDIIAERRKSSPMTTVTPSGITISRHSCDHRPSTENGRSGTLKVVDQKPLSKSAPATPKQRARLSRRRKSKNLLETVDVQQVIEHVKRLDRGQQEEVLKALGFSPDKVQKKSEDGGAQEIAGIFLQPQLVRPSIRSKSSDPLPQAETEGQSHKHPEDELPIKESKSADITEVRLELLSNWGDHCRIGLTEVRFLDADGKEVSPDLEKDFVNVIGVCAETVTDPRNLCNGKIQTVRERRMWSCPFSSKQQICLIFSIQSIKTPLQGIRIWNYNSTKATSVGVKDLRIFVNGSLCFSGKLLEGFGNPVFDYVQEISLVNDMMAGKAEDPSNPRQAKSADYKSRSGEGGRSGLSQQVDAIQSLEDIDKRTLLASKSGPNVPKWFDDIAKEDLQPIVLDDSKRRVGSARHGRRAEYDILDLYFNMFKGDDKDKKKNVTSVIEEGEGFVIPELPRGQHFQIKILSTWGDKHYVGLNGLEIFTETGEAAKISEITADPPDINVLPEIEKDPRVVTNLIDGVFRTHDDMHLWLTPYEEGRPVVIDIKFFELTSVSLVRIWNYNKSRIHSFRGVKDVQMSLDDKEIFRGEIARASGGLFGGTDAFGDTILFTTDEDILEKTSQFDSSFNSCLRESKNEEAEVHVERPKTGDSKDVACDRPFTSAKVRKTSLECRTSSSPKGKTLTLVLSEGWGDPDLIGLSKLEVIDEDGRSVALSGDDLLLNGKSCENLSRLINGHDVSCNPRDNWSTSLNEDTGALPIITINLPKVLHLAGLRVWNYNTTLENSYRGVKHLQVKVEDTPVGPPQGFLLRRASGHTHFDTVQELPFASAVVKKNLAIISQVRSRSPQRCSSGADLEVDATLPTGFIFQLNLLSTWGDPYYVGLNGLAFFDAKGQQIGLTEE
ncbi:unnamed protein product, partial [Cyprideis torosa]